MRYTLLILLTSLVVASGCGDEGETSSSSRTSAPQPSVPAPVEKKNPERHSPPAAAPAYEVATTRDLSLGTVVRRIQVKVSLPEHYTRDDVERVAEAVVADITASQRVNAIVIFFYGPQTSTSGAYDVARVEWAPNGRWGDARSVSTGDYSTFRYSVYYDPLSPVAKDDLPPSPTKFSHVRLAMNSFHVYTEDRGTFRVISEDPLHIQLSPLVVPNDFPETIEKLLKRTMLDGIFRTFIHTDADVVTVTVVPLEIIPKADTERLLPSYKQTVTVTRAKALDVSRRLLGITSFDELVETQVIADTPMTDMWSGTYHRGYYNDRSPGLDRFFVAVTR